MKKYIEKYSQDEIAEIMGKFLYITNKIKHNTSIIVEFVVENDIFCVYVAAIEKENE